MHNMWTKICAMHNMCAKICAMHSMCAKICACHNIYNICMQKYVHVIFPGYISNFIIQQNIFMIFIIYMSIPCSWEKMCMSMNLFFLHAVHPSYWSKLYYKIKKMCRQVVMWCIAGCNWYASVSVSLSPAFLHVLFELTSNLYLSSHHVSLIHYSRSNIFGRSSR